MADFRKIYGTTTDLKFFEVRIDDYTLIDEEIMSLEVKYDFFNFAIVGKLVIKDSFDINNSGLVSLNGDNKITVSMKDISETKTIKTFRVTSINSTTRDERFKIYSLGIIDEFSYQLLNTYASKSFNDTPVNGFISYLEEYELNSILENDRIEQNFLDTSEMQNFVVPQDRNILDFFSYIFRANNHRIWQDRFKLNIMELFPADLSPALDDDGDELTFSDNIEQNRSKYKIHDFENTFNNVLEVNALRPIEKNYKFDILKEPNVETVNLYDDYDNLKLNSLDFSSIQHTTGERFSTQTFQNTLLQNAEIFDIFMTNQTMQIAVPAGLKEAVVGQVIKLDFKGNPAFTDSSKEGDELMNGYYFVSQITDLITAGNLIHRYTLNRVDLNKPRKM